MARRGPARGTTCPHSPTAPHGVVNCQPCSGHRDSRCSKRGLAPHPGQHLSAGASRHSLIHVTADDAAHAANGVAACADTSWPSDFAHRVHLGMAGNPQPTVAYHCTSNDARRVPASPHNRLRQYLTQYLMSGIGTYCVLHPIHSPHHWGAHRDCIHEERTCAHIVAHASNQISQPMWACTWSAAPLRICRKIFFTTRRVARVPVAPAVWRRAHRTAGPRPAAHIRWATLYSVDPRASIDIRAVTLSITRHQPRRTVARHIDPTTPRQPAIDICRHAWISARHQTDEHTLVGTLHAVLSSTWDQARGYTSEQVDYTLAYLIAYGIPDHIRSQVRRGIPPQTLPTIPPTICTP